VTSLGAETAPQSVPIRRAFEDGGCWTHRMHSPIRMCARSFATGQDGVADSGTRCSGCTGIAVDARGTGAVTINLVGNTIQNVGGSAIVVLTGDAVSQNVNARITGNLIRQPGAFATTASEAVWISHGFASGDAGCMALRLGGAVIPAAWPSTAPNAANRITGVWDILVFGTEVELRQGQSTIVRLPGLAGGVAGLSKATTSSTARAT
jgi:hypothetical protein